MGPSRIRFVYFDLGKVIVDFDVEKMCRQMAEVVGTSPEFVHHLLYGEDLQRRYELGLITTDEFYEEFCARCGTRPDSDKLLDAACNIFTLNVNIVPIICRLSLVRFPLGLLSNTCEVHWVYLQRRFRGIMELFRVGCTSYQCHSMKPEIAIFRRAAQFAGCPPEEIFFVDDNEANVKGAQAAGFHASLYNGPQCLARELQSLGIPLVY